MIILDFRTKLLEFLLAVKIHLKQFYTFYILFVALKTKTIHKINS
jgi:hypothetical protein